MIDFRFYLGYLNSKNSSAEQDYEVLRKSKKLQGPLVWLKYLLTRLFFAIKQTTHLPTPDHLISEYYTSTVDRDYYVGTYAKNYDEVVKVSRLSDGFRTKLLLREAVVCKALQGVLPTNFVSKAGWGIRSTKLLGAFVDKGFLVVRFQKFPGVSLSKISPNLYQNIYLGIFAYMGLLNSKPRIDSFRGGLSQLTKSTMFFTGIFYAFLAISKNPAQFKLITRAIFVMITQLYTISNVFALAHRDLFSDNVLVDEKLKDITIIDWQLTLLLPQEGEASNAVAFSNYPLTVKQDLLKHFATNKALLIYFLLQKSTGSFFQNQERAEIFLLLKRVLLDIK